MKDFTLDLRNVFLRLMPDYIGTAKERMGDKILKTKSDGTPVGDLDNLAMEALRECIKKHFPNDYTIGEEDERDDAEMQRILARTDEFQWTIDGLDGTGNRRMGTTYGAMVSRRKGDVIRYAAFFRPVDQMLWKNGFFETEYGNGAWQWYGDFKDEQIQLLAAQHSQLERHTVHLEGSSKKFFKFPEIVNLGKNVTVRPSVSSCVAATAVAMGKASALVTVENKPWDTWPAIVLIEEAGGIVTDWQGKTVTPANCGSIVAAANETDHAYFVKLLNP